MTSEHDERFVKALERIAAALEAMAVQQYELELEESEHE